MIVLLAGGVGGSKLIWGLARLLPPEKFTIIGNVGDDIELHGLHISPDLDTVTYTLAGIVDRERGWGLAGDTFTEFPDHWFKLGDRDLETHRCRTNRLGEGATLTDVTMEIAHRFGVRATIIPATDASLRTIVETPEGAMNFQEFFVRERCEPEILSVRYEGDATATECALDAIRTAEKIIIAPSNPIASIGPILAVHGIREALAETRARRIAVSPLPGGRSLKGPSDRMMRATGFSPDAAGVAQFYTGLLDVLVVDHLDAPMTPATNTIMKTDEDKVRLAEFVLSV